MPEMNEDGSEKRYVVHNVAWRRQGERRGLLRRRRLVQRSKPIGEAKDIEVAAQILAQAAFYADEAILIYDRNQNDLVIGAKYGWLWKDECPSTTI